MGPKTPTHPLDHKKGSSNTYMCDVQHSFLMYDWSCFLGGMGTTKKGMHTLCNNKDKPKNYYYFWSLNVGGEVEIPKGLLRKRGVGKALVNHQRAGKLGIPILAKGINIFCLMKVAKKKGLAKSSPKLCFITHCIIKS